MASKMMLTCSSSPLSIGLNKASLSTPSQVGLGPRSIVFRAPTSRKTHYSLVVRAQSDNEGESNKDLEPIVRKDLEPIVRKDLSQVDPLLASHMNKSVAMIHTSPYMRTPWITKEDEKWIKMWFDMPGLAASDIYVSVVENVLVITAKEGVEDGFGRIIERPFECKLQLPLNCAKDETRAMLKHGVLIITVPKITEPGYFKVKNVPVETIL